MRDDTIRYRGACTLNWLCYGISELRTGSGNQVRMELEVEIDDEFGEV